MKLVEVTYTRVDVVTDFLARRISQCAESTKTVTSFELVAVTFDALLCDPQGVLILPESLVCIEIPGVLNPRFSKYGILLVVRQGHKVLTVNKDEDSLPAHNFVAEDVWFPIGVQRDELFGAEVGDSVAFVAAFGADFGRFSVGAARLFQVGNEGPVAADVVGKRVVEFLISLRDAVDVVPTTGDLYWRSVAASEGCDQCSHPMIQAIFIERSIGARREAQSYIPAVLEMTWLAVGLTEVAEVWLLKASVESGAHFAK
jgi:hypothetical protein